MESLFSICWDITSKCNDNCKYCYRNPNNPDLNIEDNKRILKKMMTLGVKKVTFVGGEPLLYQYLFDLVEYGKSINDKTIFSLTTNAIVLCNFDEKYQRFNINEELLNKIIYYFDWITFSLDTADAESQTTIGRNLAHFDRICFLLSYFKQNDFDINVKINTVINRLNLNKINDLYFLLMKYNVKRWKLLKFLPSREQALVNKSIYDITTFEFSKCIDELNNIIIKDSIKISISNDYDFKKKYITITSDGKYVSYNGYNYELKSDLLNDSIDDFINELEDKEIHELELINL